MKTANIPVYVNIVVYIQVRRHDDATLRPVYVLMIRHRVI